MADGESLAAGHAAGTPLRSWLVVYAKGVAMGAADAVPGVSGGTIALIAGVYERLVDALAGADPATLVDLLRPWDATARERAVDDLLATDAPFLAVLGTGVLTGVVVLANVVHFALGEFRAPTFALFFGVILASPVVLADEVSVRAPRGAAAFLAGVVVAFVVSGLPTSRVPGTLPVLFLVGGVAIAAMVLPGVSGSLLLLVLGQYSRMTGAVSGLTAAVGDAANGGSPAAAVEPATTLATFAAGALVGLFTFARVVSWALDAYRTATMTFLVGLMVGALRRPGAEILGHAGPLAPTTVLGLLAAGAVGALAVLGLDRATADLDY